MNFEEKGRHGCETFVPMTWLVDPGNGVYVDDVFSVEVDVKLWEERDASGLSDLTFLLLEDSTMQQKIMKRRLEQTGVNLHVVSVYSGESAIEIIKTSQRFDVIVVDQNLSGGGGLMRGHEFIEIVRNDRDFKDAIIIGCTGAVDPNISLMMMRSGADFIWPKPLPGNSTLLHYINRAMRKKKPEIAVGILPAVSGIRQEDYDGTIIVGATEIPVHMLYLIAASPVIEKLISNVPANVSFSSPEKKIRGCDYATDPTSCSDASLHDSLSDYLSMSFKDFDDESKSRILLVNGFSITSVEEILKFSYVGADEWVCGILDREHIRELLKLASLLQIKTLEEKLLSTF
jgi:CheY-like chemotaxis protein